MPEQDLTPNEVLLIKIISDISEDHYCARWLHGIEVILWEQLLGEARHVNDERMSELRDLSQKIQAWATWDHGSARIIPLIEWQHLYAVRQDLRQQSEAGFTQLKATYEMYCDDPEFRRRVQQLVQSMDAQNN
jgi:hypothetical protein